MAETDFPQFLPAFLAVAETGSFTAGAARLGLSPSAISQQIRALERQLGCVLFQRTTRSVRPTDAGLQYRAAVAPAVAAIREAAEALDHPNAAARGRLRLTLPRTAFETVLRPILARYSALYPQVTVELSIDNALVDIVRDGFDAGIRFGNLIEQDMVAVRVAPDMRIALLASPAYLDARGRPTQPRDLAEHACIGFRSATAGTVEPWHLARKDKAVRLIPKGPLVVNNTEALLAAAEDGLGIIEFVEELALDGIAAGRLESVLKPWCPMLPGFHIHYPDRLRTSSALRALLALLKSGAGG
ncbi:LysR family transcriptional regulator [Sphingomonas abietis]|uniref:LysR family transcriptional regulator n=1 Tax=Sphingomonas abietis TaxID=3012344 RepID=A0ABY7NGN6_9SPHN|nr:LysR family transcriptional regulator [Sphingomonas abietis]WBO20709.1 LysR family transcriptional regulator [Sphingomonas abietis]